jgi:hypothetical protein
MKKTSDKVASKVGKVVLGVGLIAAIVCPFAGAGLAAWSTGAAAISSLGLAAGIPLAGAGAFGGFVLGAVAAPVVAGLSVAASGIAWGVTKMIGSVVEWMVSGGREKQPEAPASHADMTHSLDSAGARMGGLKLARMFDSAQSRKPANENKPQPQYKKALGFSR